MKYLFPYLLIINALGLLLMLADKLRAKNSQWRIPEATLLVVAAAGGSVGSLAGMHLFRHKTRRPKFTVGIPVMLALQVLLFILLY